MSSSSLPTTEMLWRSLLGELAGETEADRLLQDAPACPFETDPWAWVSNLLPAYVSNPGSGELVPFAERHDRLWQWAWSLERGVKPRPFVGIWPRGGAKSTTAELVGVAVGARCTRRYVLYICDTLERAEDHVSNVAGMLESPLIERYYPHISRPLVSKTGALKGWRRNRLRTAGGFTVDALGMDVAARGVKLDEVRPDLIVIDDIDVEGDGPAATTKKIRTLTTKFLPAGSPDSAVLFVQNLIHPESIASRLAGVASEPADFLRNRILSGPYKAVDDLEWAEEDDPESSVPRYVITAGRPTWQGMDLPECEAKMNEWGLSAFLSEGQQEVGDVRGGLFGDIDFEPLRVHIEDVPDLTRVEAWIDPAVTETDNSDSHGIQIDGLGVDGLLYRLYSWEGRTSPARVIEQGILKAIEYGATTLGFEADQGGDTWRDLYTEIVRRMQEEGHIPPDVRPPAFASDKVGALKKERIGTSDKSKAGRTSKMLLAYEHKRIRHVFGTHHILERALRRYLKKKPYDLVDAAWWGWLSLLGITKPFRSADVRAAIVHPDASDDPPAAPQEGRLFD